LVYLAEHEIDRPGAAQKAAVVLSTLIGQTFLDYELHALYARFLVDAQVNEIALSEARMSIYLNPAPTLNDLRFISFIWLIAARDHVDELKEIIRETAATQADAEIIIKEVETSFNDQNTKPVFTPGNG